MSASKFVVDMQPIYFFLEIYNPVFGRAKNKTESYFKAQIITSSRKIWSGAEQKKGWAWLSILLKR